MAAVRGIDIHIYFTYGGILRLKKEYVDKIGDEDRYWVMVSKEGGLTTRGIQKISELLENLSLLDGKIYACPTAMAIHNISKDELIDYVTEVKSLGKVVDLLDENTTMIYV